MVLLSFQEKNEVIGAVVDHLERYGPTKPAELAPVIMKTCFKWRKRPTVRIVISWMCKRGLIERARLRGRYSGYVVRLPGSNNPALNNMPIRPTVLTIAERSILDSVEDGARTRHEIAVVEHLNYNLICDGIKKLVDKGLIVERQTWPRTVERVHKSCLPRAVNDDSMAVSEA